MCADAVAVPVAIRYVFLREQRPECLIRIGMPIQRDDNVQQLTRALEVGVQQELARIDSDALQESRDDYRLLFEGRRSLSTFFDRLTFWRSKG
jgi:hypothetical protein